MQLGTQKDTDRVLMQASRLSQLAAYTICRGPQTHTRLPGGGGCLTSVAADRLDLRMSGGYRRARCFS